MTFEDALTGDEEACVYPEAQQEFKNQLCRRSERITKGKPPNRYGYEARLATEQYEEPRNRNEALSAADREE